MKKIISSLLFVFILFAAFAQDTITKLKKSDIVVFDVFTDVWQQAPQSATLKDLQPGISYSSFQDYPLGSSNFSFAYGAGLSFHNVRSSSILGYDSTDYSTFVRLSDFKSDIQFKVNKHVLTYIETPIELRYRLKGKNTFRINLGFRFGFLLQEHSKYYGDDFRNGTTHSIKYKEFKHRNFNPYRYGITARIGYKWVNLFGYYSLTSIFKKGTGPEMYPISFGISIIPL